jgi:hypothetical protein
MRQAIRFAHDVAHGVAVLLLAHPRKHVARSLQPFRGFAGIGLGLSLRSIALLPLALLTRALGSILLALLAGLLTLLTVLTLLPLLTLLLLLPAILHRR